MPFPISGLLEWFEGNETSASSGLLGSHNSTIATAANSPGATGTHRTFNGTTQYFNLGANFGFGVPGDDYSIYLEVDTDPSITQAMIGYQETSSTKLLQVDTTAQYFRTALGQSSPGYAISISSVTTAAWHSVLYTVSKVGVMRIYLDGVLQSTPGTIGQNFATTLPLFIGARNNDGTPGQHFTGSMKRIGFWDRELAQAEATALHAGAPYPSGFAGPANEAALADILASAASWRAYTAANGDLRIPAIMTLTQPMVHGDYTGGKIVGQGYTQPVANTTIVGPNSSVIFSPASRTGNETVWVYHGQQSIYKSFGIYGATHAEVANASVTPPAILFDVARASAVGTGKLWLENMIFSYATGGVRGGTTRTGPSSANSDMVTFHKCGFDRLNVAIRMVSEQSKGWTFYEPQIGGCPIFLDCQAGGDVSIYRGTVESDTILLNFDPSDGGAGFGTDASNYTVREIMVDDNANGTQMLAMESGAPYYADIKFDRCFMPAGQAINTPVWTIAGNTICTIDGQRNLQAGMLAWNNPSSTYHPVFVVDSCRTAGLGVGDALDLFNVAASSGDCTVVVTGCSDTEDPSTRIADLAGQTLHGDLP